MFVLYWQAIVNGLLFLQRAFLLLDILHSIYPALFSAFNLAELHNLTMQAQSFYFDVGVLLFTVKRKIDRHN